MQFKIKIYNKIYKYFERLLLTKYNQMGFNL